MKHPFFLICFTLLFLNCTHNKNKQLANIILEDTLFDRVELMALEVAKEGFNAGDGYGEIWIRDYNTFIELAMEVLPDSLIQENLLCFFRFQDSTGGIVDGFIDKNKVVHSKNGYQYLYSDLEPRFAAHKNTVETDHESSLIQAVSRYVQKSGNRAFIELKVGDKTVIQRIEFALEFLMTERYSEKYGLLWGATTADWGDVQPEHPWGVVLDENSHLSIDIYDNAFFIIAINCYLDLITDVKTIKHWKRVRKGITSNVRKHLWDSDNQKFIPHLYLENSPFPKDFDENQIYYHGGTAMAIQAGLLTKDEIATANAKILANVKESGAPTIGLTLYPTYPEGFFKNKGMYPYGYQNGGDWTWFGARMIHQLISYGFVQEAYDEAHPMFKRVLDNNGFFEWYSLDGVPSGSGTFRGSAGVLYKSIQDFRHWAKENQ